MNWDITVAVIGAIAYLIFILYNRKSRTFANFSVADRSIGFFILFASLSANFIGPGFTLGLTQKGFSSGYFYFFIAGSYGLGKIIEGYFIAPKLREKFTNAFSIGDVVAGEQGHNSKILHFIVGLISFGLLIGLSVVMSKSAGEVLNNFLGIPKMVGTFIITSIVTAYSIYGGLKTTMLTDTVQFLLFLILIPVLILLVFFKSNFDFSLFIDTAVTLTRNEFISTPSIAIFALTLTWSLGEVLMPFTVHTILAGKNSKTAQRALTYSGMLMIIWLFLMLSLGVLAKIVLVDVSNNDQVLLNLANDYYATGLFGLFTVAIVGVIMSSQDALINCASVVFTRDILEVFKSQPDNEIILSRVSGIVVGILSILFASFIPSIIDGLMLFYSIWVPSVLVVAIFAIFLKQPSPKAAIASIIVGSMSSILWNLTNWRDVIPNILVGLVLSISVYVIFRWGFKAK